MYQLITNGNYQMLVAEMNKKGLVPVQMSLSMGVMTVLARSSKIDGELELVMGYNAGESIQKINSRNGRVECALMDGPNKVFLVRFGAGEKRKGK